MNCETCGGFHPTVSEAAQCLEAYDAYVDELEARAEQAAEMANERWFEDRGWEEALAERAWEDSRGVIQWEDARDAAEAAAARA